MVKGITLAVSASLVFAGLIVGQEVKRVPIQPPSTSDGKGMFVQYCAVCHGEQGKGDGPAAASLKKRPADLTQLSRKNGSVFPEEKVFRYIKGSDEVSAHGTRDMPVWGEAIRSLRPNSPEVADLRIANLEKYVETLQAK